MVQPTATWVCSNLFYSKQKSKRKENYIAFPIVNQM